MKYITLVNLLRTDELFPDDLTPYDPAQPDADQVLFPEYLTSEDRSDALAEHVVRWLTDETERGRVVAELEILRSEVAHGGAADSAAKLITAELRRRKGAAPATAFPSPRDSFSRQALTPGEGDSLVPDTPHLGSRPMESRKVRSPAFFAEHLGCDMLAWAGTQSERHPTAT